MLLFQSDPIPSDNRFVESQSWFRAIPFDELTNRIIVGSLRTRGGQAASDDISYHLPMTGLLIRFGKTTNADAR